MQQSGLLRTTITARLDELSRFIYKPAIPIESAVRPSGGTRDVLKF
jgi:hypothetical protein